MAREKRAIILAISFILLFTFPISASDMNWGLRGFLGGGYPSGKGLWDWTDPAQKGELHWGAAGGCGLILQIPLRDKISLVSEAAYAYAGGRQSLDHDYILYTQQSVEIFFLIKGRLPVEYKGIHLVTGLGIMFPLEGRMDGLSAEPEKPGMICLKAGLDFPSCIGEWGEWYLSGYFVHPITSPGYGWVDESSGSVRINRVDLAVTWLLPGRSA